MKVMCLSNFKNNVKEGVYRISHSKIYQRKKPFTVCLYGNFLVTIVLLTMKRDRGIHRLGICHFIWSSYFIINQDKKQLF